MQSYSWAFSRTKRPEPSVCHAVLRDNLLESLLSKNKEQAQDWIMRLLVLPWLEAAAQHAALSTIDRQVLQLFAEECIFSHMSGRTSDRRAW